MTTVSTIIHDAYRESSLTAIGTDPTAAEQAEALRLFNRYLLSMYGTRAGEELTPIPIGRNNIERPSGYPYYDGVPDGQWIVPLNSRLILNLTTAQEVFLDPNPQDGERFAYIDSSGNLDTFNFTVNANGRKIDGEASLLIEEASVKAEYLYRADLGEWKRVTPLTDDDDMPFPEEFDDMFVIGTAIRINPRHWTQLDPQSVEEYKRLSGAFKSRYRQTREVPSELALIRTLGKKRRWYSATRQGNADFIIGHPWGYYR